VDGLEVAPRNLEQIIPMVRAKADVTSSSIRAILLTNNKHNFLNTSSSADLLSHASDFQVFSRVTFAQLTKNEPGDVLASCTIHLAEANPAQTPPSFSVV